MNAIAKTLKVMRTEAEMTVRDAEAEARRKTGTSVSRNTISSLERGVNKPRQATMEALAWAYGGSTEEDPKTIMNLWRLEFARDYGEPEGYDPRFGFLKWHLRRERAIAGAQDPEAQLELVGIFISKEESEAKRRHLEKQRALLERGEWKPSRNSSEAFEKLGEQLAHA